MAVSRAHTVIVVLTWALTAQAALVILLTRMRLGRAGAAGRLDVGSALPGGHFTVGALTLACWTGYLLGSGPTTRPETFLVGATAVLGWWTIACLGLLILVRWIPSHGGHAAAPVQDSWSKGPLLSLVGHLTVLGDAVFFSWVFLTAALQPGGLT